MKILIVNSYYYPNMIGGAEFSIKILAENLAAKGHEVSVLSMDGKPETEVLDFYEINKVKVFRSYSKSLYRRRLQKKKYLKDKIWNGIHSIWNFKMNKDVRKVVDMIEPDIIHTQNLVSMSYWIWKYAKSKNMPVVHTLRDYWLLDPTTNIGQTSEPLVKYFRKYHRYMSDNYVTMVTAPSDRTLEIFKDNNYFSGCPAVRVVNAIPLNYELLTECLKEKSERDENKISFIFAGHLSENKGIKILINAFLKSNTEASLIICGTGELEEWIREKKDKRIIMLGRLRQQDLFEQYRKADVQIVPSVWEEPFGRIVIEAAQYGLPTIGSNRGGIPEIIKQLQYGVVYDVSEDRLIELIKKYSNREYLRKIYALGPQNLEKYSIENQIADFEKLYEKVCKGE
ncbi:MAG: glycosyltransferase family 4 protein [Candidatus Gastranaerophilaceae bacterium]